MHEIVVAVVILVLTLVYMVGALQLPPPIKDGLPTESSYPWILIGIMCVACFAVLFPRKLWRVKGQIVQWQQIKRTVWAIAVIGCYLLLFTYFGYWPSTILLSFGLSMLFEYDGVNKKRALVYSAVLAIVIPLFGYLFFQVFFGIRLPGSVWS